MARGKRIETLNEKLLYRKPMIVKKFAVSISGCLFPICPRCNLTVGQEYQSFCDRCGQRLSWIGFSNIEFWGVKEG